MNNYIIFELSQVSLGGEEGAEEVEGAGEEGGGGDFGGIKGFAAFGADEFALADGGQVDLAFGVGGAAGRGDGRGIEVSLADVEIGQQGSLLGRGDRRSAIFGIFSFYEALGEVGPKIAGVVKIEIFTSVAQVSGI